LILISIYSQLGNISREIKSREFNNPNLYKLTGDKARDNIKNLENIQILFIKYDIKNGFKNLLIFSET